MNLKETWGNKVWEDAETIDLIVCEMSGHETLEAKVDYLAGCLARLIDKTTKNDQEILNILAAYQWEITD